MQWCMPDPSTGMVEARGSIMSSKPPWSTIQTISERMKGRGWEDGSVNRVLTVKA